VVDFYKSNQTGRSVALKKSLIIIGAGGHGRSIADIVLESDEYDLVGFFDDAYPELKMVWNIPVLGGIDAAYSSLEKAKYAFVAIGNNTAREVLFRKLHHTGLVLPSIIHRSAVISARAEIGPGVAIMGGAVIGTEAVLGEGVIVNSGAVVDHHCKVDDFAHLGVQAAMAGGSILGRGAWMKAGSAVGYGVKIGAGCILAPGEAVTR